MAKQPQKTKPASHGGKPFKIEYKNAAQKLVWAAFDQHDVIFVIGPAGCGKSFLASAYAISQVISKSKQNIILTRPIVESGESLGFLPGPQPLDAKILTPYGWTTMGSILPGDEIICRNGQPALVDKIYPKGKKPVYRLTTLEGTSTECCEDHLWFTYSAEDKKRGRLGSVKTTKTIIETLRTHHGKANHFLPRNEAVNFPKANLPIPPYTFGAILGDGHIGNNVCIAITEPEMVARISEELKSINLNLTSHKSSINYNITSSVLKRKPARSVRLTIIDNGFCETYTSAAVASSSTQTNLATVKHRCTNNLSINGVKYEFISLKNRWSNPIKNILSDLGLLGKKSYNKFIPDLYKYSSVEDRLNLLRGLMDTDGTIKKNGEMSFCTTSKTLADDVIEIVRSLGGRSRVRTRNRINHTSKIANRTITSRRLCYEFNISLPDGFNPFFLARKSIKFRGCRQNTIGIKSIEMVGEKEVKCISVANQEHLYLTDDFLVTHNTFSEKVDPYMLPLYDAVDKIVGKQGTQFETISRALEVAPLAYLRGRTFDDATCIFDEAQNATKMQLKMYLTRLGENSKMIITGDPQQSDLRGEVALMDVVRRLEGVPGIAVVEMKAQSIVRHPLVGAILNKLEPQE